MAASKHSWDDEKNRGFVNMNVISPSQTTPTDLVDLKDFTTENFSVLFDDLNVSLCSDLSPTQLEVNDIYGKLVDTHKKAILCYRRILFNIKNKFENNERDKEEGYRLLRVLFNEIESKVDKEGAEEVLQLISGSIMTE